MKKTNCIIVHSVNIDVLTDYKPEQLLEIAFLITRIANKHSGKDIKILFNNSNENDNFIKIDMYYETKQEISNSTRTLEKELTPEDYNKIYHTDFAERDNLIENLKELDKRWKK